jgi:hypothetical protein
MVCSSTVASELVQLVHRQGTTLRSMKVESRASTGAARANPLGALRYTSRALKSSYCASAAKSCQSRCSLTRASVLRVTRERKPSPNIHEPDVLPARGRWCEGDDERAGRSRSAAKQCLCKYCSRRSLMLWRWAQRRSGHICTNTVCELRNSSCSEWSELRCNCTIVSFRTTTAPT